MPDITLPDGTVKSFDETVTCRQIASSIGPGLARAAVGAKVDGRLVDLASPVDRDASVSILTRPKKGTPVDQQDPDALWLLRHSTAHVMA